MKQLTELNTWNDLKSHVDIMQFQTISDLRQLEPLRSQTLCFSSNSIQIDFSSQRINKTTLDLLIELANDRDLKERIDDLLQGSKVNYSENRAALHTALRTQDSQPITVDGHNIIPSVLGARKGMFAISEKIRSHEWLGYSGKPITDIVNIGIGGSDLGPKFCMNALREYTDKSLGYHFISDADPHAFSTAVENLNPETTLFIISSKSFTTQETLYNADKAIRWLGTDNHIENHMIAVTANTDKASQYGIKHILPIWDWVGGRYSATSAINLITAIAIGPEQFNEFLIGANQMDTHFRDSEFHTNLPVLLALIGIWNNNFLHIHNLLLLTYAQSLEYFVDYIQQLDMESNGKSIDNEGRAVNYSTGPIVWGGAGNQAQHSYYQLLCQGTHRFTLDFITVKTYERELIYDMYMAKKTILTDGFTTNNAPNEFIPGNIPLTHICLDNCLPRTIGQLIALYEHKIYVQSVIWGINSFDQPGVEGAKRKRTTMNQETAKSLE